ncbi:hypothetical protein CHS0354_017575 [Potamilus streckersoni]|uniref:Uncharacterized protein n=1 Tax=Potamilus streckersoni TaxID=2493646 RepID=A0AAE0RP25_9BIVA|nr:hypothetical protein CHS0354_017575 [Potamilus streckersoni]
MEQWVTYVLERVVEVSINFVAVEGVMLPIQVDGPILGDDPILGEVGTERAMDLQITPRHTEEKDQNESFVPWDPFLREISAV